MNIVKNVPIVRILRKLQRVQVLEKFLLLEADKDDPIWGIDDREKREIIVQKKTYF